MILFTIKTINIFYQKSRYKSREGTKSENLRRFKYKVKKILETSPHFPIMRKIGFIFDEIMAKRILT